MKIRCRNRPLWIQLTAAPAKHRSRIRSIAHAACSAINGSESCTARSSAEALLDIYKQRYQHELFVRLYPLGGIPDIRAVNRTNFCDIGIKFDPTTGRAVVVSAIDNLTKGAAGQAIQNMNLMLGLAETEGLL